MLVRDDGGLAVTFADYRLTVPDQAVAAHPGLERFLDRQVILGIRPSSLEDAAFAPPRWPRIKAEAKVTERLGSEVDVIFAVKTPPVQHDVMVAQFDLAAKQPAGQDQEQTGRLVGEGESQWTASVNPTPASDPAAPSTWPLTPRSCTGTTPTAARPSPGGPPAEDVPSSVELRWRPR